MVELVETLWRNLLVSLDLIVAIAVFFLVLELGRSKANGGSQSSRGSKNLDLWLIAGCLLGGRIGAVIPEASVYLDSPLDLIRINTGLSLYGAIFGGAVALVAFGGRGLNETRALADSFSLYLPLGIGLFHLGCFVYGFCGGKPAPFPLGIPLPGHVGLRYPSEILEGVLALGLFLVLLKLPQRGLFLGGVTGLFLVIYPAIHTLVDLTRLSSGPWPWADPVVSLVFALAGISVLLLGWRSNLLKPSAHQGRLAR